MSYEVLYEIEVHFTGFEQVVEPRWERSFGGVPVQLAGFMALRLTGEQVIALERLLRQCREKEMPLTPLPSPPAPKERD